jgi:hypothetical protein
LSLTGGLLCSVFSSAAVFKSLNPTWYNAGIISFDVSSNRKVKTVLG